MFLFLRLLLAHLIGDFPLQISAVYSRKVKNVSGKILHVATITIVMILLAWPFWRDPYLWLVIFVNSIGHYIQDWIKLAIVQRIKNPNNFFIFMIDQILHVATLSILFLTPLRLMTPVAKGNSIFEHIYFSDPIIIIFILFMTAGFSGTFIIATFKATFLSKKLETPYLSTEERTYGAIERMAMIGLLLLSPWFALLLPVFVYFKTIYANFQIKRLKENSFGPFLIDTLLGILLTLIIYGTYRCLV